MRVVRIAPARQLALFAGEDGFSARWDGLPEQVQAQVLALLARMIARSVLGPGAAGSSWEVPS
jgi:hypothetical protein